MRGRLAVTLVVTTALLSCSDAGVMMPLDDGFQATPSLSISDAGHGGSVDGFWFLPPLAKQVTVEGALDGGLEPAMRVCELDGNPSAAVNPGWAEVSCVVVDGSPVVVTYFAPGSATVGESDYQFSWDTDASPDNLAPMDPDKFYRIEIFLEDVSLGHLDVNPQHPAGETPGADFEDLYAFRIGENLPVKVFLSPAARCALAEGYVTQCTASAVVDESGTVLSLEQEGWSTLSTVVPPDALPDGYPSIVLTLERIDPALFYQETGEHCIPGLGYPVALDAQFDAPRWGDCLRVTTDPVLPVELEAAAIIEICIDVFDLQGLKFGEEQDARLQIIRFGDDGETQGLPNVQTTTCAPSEPSPDQLGLLPVPESGMFRYAAVAVNRVARWLGPAPLVAHGSISLGGSTSEFSRFQWGLPGGMVKEQGDGTLVQQLPDGGESYDVTVQVKVQDSGSESPSGAPSAVEDATVHFSGDGTVSAADVSTGADGIAQVTWTLPETPGVYTLDAKALGLLAGPVPDHDILLEFNEATVTFTATVVGPPSATTQSPPPEPPLTGLPGETLDTPLTFTVVDVNGEPVSGWPVEWTTTCSATDPVECDGYVTGDAVTGADGSASGLWTLATTPGDNTATATVGGVSFAFVAGTWNAIGQCLVVVDGAIGETEWSCAEMNGDVATFTANISGGDTPAEVRWQSDGENLYFLVKVTQSSLDKTNSLRLDFDNTLDGATADDDAIGFDAGGGGFFDEYLTSRCVNRSQSGCGATDQLGQDGAGALGNDGTYTIYELSHPLQGTPGEDFVVSQGDALGFYLTLRIGNGAQGNTQFPGFRNYLNVTIR